MKRKIMMGDKGFIFAEIIPVLASIQVFAVFILLGFMIAFNYSVFYQWTKFLNVQESSIVLNNIANNLDACISPKNNPTDCNQRMIDKRNMPFLVTSYQSPHFRYDINTHYRNGAFCVINAVMVDAKRNPVYNSVHFPKVSFDCGDHHITPLDRLSGFSLCRDQYGNRTIFGYGMYQTF